MKIYLVYNTETYKIVGQFDFFSSEINKLIQSVNIDWINTTHPTSSTIKKMIIDKIKEVNNLN